MGKPTIEMLERKLSRGVRVLSLLFFLVPLVACEQIVLPKAGNTKPKTMATKCHQEWGICVSAKWRATGVVYPAYTGTREGFLVSEEPDRVEILVLAQFENTCDPAPEWFRAEDEAMGAIARKDPKERSQNEQEQLELYQRRAELDCSRVEAKAARFTLKDKYGFTLFVKDLHENENNIMNLDPSVVAAESDERVENKAQAKFSVPRPYLEQIEDVIVSGKAKRIWKNGVNREKQYAKCVEAWGEEVCKPWLADKLRGKPGKDGPFGGVGLPKGEEPRRE